MCPTGSTSLQQAATLAVDEAATRLAGSERGGVRVEALLHYGAVEIDPRHLVIWILLSGKRDDQLPEWMQIDPGLTESPESGHVDYRWLLELRGEIVRRFAAVGWPTPDRIAVYADSSRRVDESGGWFYFKHG